MLLSLLIYFYFSTNVKKKLHKKERINLIVVAITFRDPREADYYDEYTHSRLSQFLYHELQTHNMKTIGSNLTSIMQNSKVA